jgi:VanZ family protein
MNKLAYTLLDPAFQRLCYRMAIVGYLMIVFFGSIPGARAEIGQYASGALLHSLAYSGLAVLLYIGRGSSLAERAIGAVLIVMVMGAGDEGIQSFLPYRGAAIEDWLVDTGAAIAASAAMTLTYPRLICSASDKRNST